jgi:nucleotide-binding universal stress UspA family protein
MSRCYPIQPDQLLFPDETAVAALQQKTCELETDPLVMGVNFRLRLSQALIGSMAEKVLDFLRADFMINKPGQV